MMMILIMMTNDLKRNERDFILNLHSSHSMPSLRVMRLIRTRGVLPMLSRMVAMIFGFAVLKHQSHHHYGLITPDITSSF